MNLFPKIQAPYFIYTPPYTHTSSGVRVLHLLCHALNESGQKAYLIPQTWEGFAANPHLNTPVIKPEYLNYYNTSGVHPIAVYPDTVRGNPLNCKKIVHFLLAPPGAYGGDSVFPPTDKIWCNDSTIASGVGNDHVLKIPTFDHHIFYPPPKGSKRQGKCFYAHKYDRIHGNPLLDITRGFIRLEGSSQQLADILRRSEVCYTYEPSEVAISAELSGCPIVMIRTPYFDRLPPRNPEHKMFSARWHDEPAEPIDNDQLAIDALAVCREMEAALPAQLARFIQDTQS